MSDSELRIEVDMGSAVGPRIMAWGLGGPESADADQAAIESEVPVGYEIDWGNEVQLDSGGLSWPLVLAQATEWELHSCKGRDLVYGTVEEARERAVAMDRNLQPSGGVSIIRRCDGADAGFEVR